MLSPRPLFVAAPLTLAALLAAPALAQVQTTATLVPVADAFVSGAPTRVDQNFGDAGALAIASPGSPAGEARTLMRFDATGLPQAWDVQFGPGAWQITGLRLDLTVATPRNAIFNQNLLGEYLVYCAEND
ncbi:MAG: hypothetical protein KDA05_01360, partial [Phycisphaerales bacterium]|nr:hypothetical protein [Phycisphaerales bacterium]